MRAPPSLTTPPRSPRPRAGRRTSWLGVVPLRLALALALAWMGGCSTGTPHTHKLPAAAPLTDNERETYARRHLIDARALRDEGRLEAAARVAARGLELRPDDPELQRLRAELLESLGRLEEAQRHRERAATLSPPPPVPPEVPLEGSSAALLIDLLPPLDDPDLRDRVPRTWPAGAIAQTVERRLRTRLPDARVRYLTAEAPASVQAGRDRLERLRVRGAISLRVERSFCGRSLKDGEFAVAWLRVATAAPDGETPAPRQLRTVLSPPRGQQGCREEAMAEGVEDALALPEVRALFESAEEQPGSWETGAIRTLYPSLGRRIVREIDAGRLLLRSGRLEGAIRHFAAAVDIDPDDRDARAFLDDARSMQALSTELSEMSRGDAPEQAATPGSGMVIEPFYDPAARRAMEARLREEKRRRDELLAALSMLDSDVEAPSERTIAALRPGEIRDSEEVGPRLVRGEAPPGAALSVRLLYAPDGTVLARYYFVGDSPVPLLREEDADGDGRADRWVAYAEGVRARAWESRRGDGQPDVHLVFGDGGESMVRLELDSQGRGRPDRIFHYRDGRLVGEDRDTTGNGSFDLFEKFDASGSLDVREEDVDGDGNIDVRTLYRDGRIARREIVNPDAVTEFQ